MNKNNSFQNSNLNTKKISQSFGRLVLQIKRLERQPRSFGDAGSLTPSETHTIDAIGYENGILMSELAARLGVTKGAVTQIVGRLEAKQLVKRSSHPIDSRSVVVSLTEKGERAYLAHEELHKEFYGKLFEGFNKEDIKVFEKCLDKLNDFLQKH